MGFKNYLFASVFLLVFIVWYTYTLALGNYTFIIDINILSIYFKQTLPIYVWVILPAFVLFIATILHMLYYGSVGYFQRQALTCDVKSINDYVEKRLLNLHSDKKLKTKEFKELGLILDSLNIEVSDEEFISSNKSLESISQKISEINSNKFVSIKALKLDENNPIELKNLINRINNDSNFALEVLKNASQHSKKIIKNAFNVVLENKEIQRIKSLSQDFEMDNEMLSSLLLKDLSLKPEQRYTNNEILILINENKLSNKELINLASKYKTIMQPEQLISLFEDIMSSDESLTESYLYVLFQYEMISQIKEIVENSQKDEYIIFKALIDLKDAGKHYSIESLKLS